MAVGCGGSSSEERTDPTGLYQCAYDRLAGTLTIGINADGTVDVTVADGPADVYTGTAILTHNNTFSAQCLGLGGKTITVSGTVAGSGTGRTVNGTVAGEFTIHYTASFAHSPDHTIFENHYEAFFHGSSQGILSGDVDASGGFTGSMSIDQGATIPLTGDVSSTGFIELTGTSGGTTYQFEGTMRLANQDQILMDGLWRTNLAGEGDWHGGNSNEG